MATFSGIYKYYEGTDAQCSGVQLRREGTWATDVGSNGAIRYLDCSGNVHYIYPGVDQSGYWQEHTANSIKPLSDKITYHPSGIWLDDDGDAFLWASGTGDLYMKGGTLSRLYVDSGDIQLYQRDATQVNVDWSDINIKAYRDLDLFAYNGDLTGSGSNVLMRAWSGSARVVSDDSTTNIEAYSDVNILSGEEINVSGDSNINFTLSSGIHVSNLDHPGSGGSGSPESPDVVHSISFSGLYDSTLKEIGRFTFGWNEETALTEPAAVAGIWSLVDGYDTGKLIAEFGSSRASASALRRNGLFLRQIDSEKGGNISLPESDHTGVGKLLFGDTYEGSIYFTEDPDYKLYMNSEYGIELEADSGDINLLADGSTILASGNGINLIANNDTGDINILQNSNDPINIFAPSAEINISGDYVTIEAYSGWLTLRSPNGAYIYDLPYSDPLTSGQLWDNSGVLSISHGP